MSDFKWYIVHTHTGGEMTAKLAIEKAVQMSDMQENFGKILVPVENVVEVVKGKKSQRTRKFFPGYIFVQMRMSEGNWHLVKKASKVSGFVGRQGVPAEVPESEVLSVTKQMEVGTARPRVEFNFSLGEQVVVTDGPFNNFNGTIEDIDEAKSRVKVLVSIFGRPTPVELDFVQVKKA